MQRLSIILVIAIVPVLIVGCAGDNTPQSAADSGREETPKVTTPSSPHSPGEKSSTMSPAGKPPVMSGLLPDPLRGTVKETMDSGGYTYVRLQTDQGDVWAAAKQFAVSTGQDVEVRGMMPMRAFHSATLDRTFDEIQFVSSARVLGDSPSAGSMPPQEGGEDLQMPPGHPALGAGAASAKAAGPPAPAPGEIEALAGGSTVAEVIGNKSDLVGKTVKFRGKVIKANRGILGKNWLHIQDGTGEPGSNDITVTSVSGFAPPGSVVVVEGTVALDKDFGAGYAYAVIVEDATIVAEPTKSESAEGAE